MIGMIVSGGSLPRNNSCAEDEDEIEYATKDARGTRGWGIVKAPKFQHSSNAALTICQRGFVIMPSFADGG